MRSEFRSGKQNLQNLQFKLQSVLNIYTIKQVYAENKWEEMSLKVPFSYNQMLIDAIKVQHSNNLPS